MKMKVQQVAWWLALGAGSMDFCTGLGLIFAPKMMVTLMGVALPGVETVVWVRWVGAFVWAVGGSYLLALALGGAARLRMVLEFTILFRFAAGVVSAVAIIMGWLAPAWASVPVTDLALVAAQAWLLRKGGWDHE
jgi:hypothetical protein